jgi:hypothetical protein
VRTVGNPLVLAPLLRLRISESRSDFRVQTIQPQNNFVRWHLLRERLLAALSSFFGIVALVLAAVGLYGVLNYSVIQGEVSVSVRDAAEAAADALPTRFRFRQRAPRAECSEQLG